MPLISHSWFTNFTFAIPVLNFPLFFFWLHLRLYSWTVQAGVLYSAVRWMIPAGYMWLPCSVCYLSSVQQSCVCVCVCVCGAVVISPQTSAGGQGLGNGKGCWRHVTSWAAASLTNHWVAGGDAGSPPSVQPPLPAMGKHTACHTLSYSYHGKNNSWDH